MVVAYFCHPPPNPLPSREGAFSVGLDLTPFKRNMDLELIKKIGAKARIENEFLG